MRPSTSRSALQAAPASTAPSPAPAIQSERLRHHDAQRRQRVYRRDHDQRRHAAGRWQPHCVCDHGEQRRHARRQRHGAGVTVNSGGHVAPGSSAESLATRNSRSTRVPISTWRSAAPRRHTTRSAHRHRHGDPWRDTDEQADQWLQSRQWRNLHHHRQRRHNDLVNGTFAGLDEGEFFTHNGSSYSISYGRGPATTKSCSPPPTTRR